MPFVLAGLAVALLAGTWAVWSGRSSNGPARGTQSETYAAKRGGFEITVPASGELQALKQIEIRNRLETRALITEIIPEGTMVKEGDVVLRLADDEIRDKIKNGEDEVKTAEAAKIAAESTLAIRLSERESDLARADLDIELAGLALKAWREGELVSKRKELALAIETAQINYDRLVERYEDSKRLVEQQFISTDELKRDKIEMIEARARLDQAKLDIDVYEQYTYHQEEAQKLSDLKQAREERMRVEQRHDAELETVRADVASKTYKLASARERLAHYKQQLESCMVRAPSDGLVVYASSLEQNGWRNDGQPPQVGTELRQNERVMVLPDTSQMIAAVKVNEALSGQIAQGQLANVISDAVPGVVLSGEVQSIGVLAEQGGWRDPNRRDYTVRILISGGNEFGLKPSMRCKADIHVGQVNDAVYVPVQAVFRDGPTTFVYTPRSGGYAKSPVKLGRASELYVEIAEGIEPGQTVLLRKPRVDEIVSSPSNERLAEQPRPEREPKPAAAPSQQKPTDETEPVTVAER